MADICDEELPKGSNRPSDSNFLQQKLRTYSVKHLIAPEMRDLSLISIGITMIIFGISFLLATEKFVHEKIIDYTNCQPEKSNLTCAQIIEKNPLNECRCDIPFELTQNITRNVYVYYQLTNYYQNHRLYVKSRDDNQLLGKLGPVSDDCVPFARRYVNGKEKQIVPCGAIANSLFNDTFEFSHRDTKNRTFGVKILRTGIAWPSDLDYKFKNPANFPSVYNDYANPPNWNNKTIADLDPRNPDNNGMRNEPFIVWMRTAALPTFRKIYGRVDHDINVFHENLPKGEYKLTVFYHYPVTMFGGTKSIVISNTSLLGGRNPFFGILYIISGLMVFVCYLIMDQNYLKLFHRLRRR